MFCSSFCWPCPSARPRAGRGRLTKTPREEAALKKNAEAFIAAFDKGDAKAVAAFWTADGDYAAKTSPPGGRDEIENFIEFFSENKGPR